MTSISLPATQMAILERALEAEGRLDGAFPAALRGAARAKVLHALVKAGLAKAQAKGHRLTPAGYAAVGQPQAKAATKAPRKADSTKARPAAPPATAAITPATTPRTRANSKQAMLIDMLKRPEGATIAQIQEATGWQAHTVRGTFAGTLRKRLQLTVTSSKAPDGTRIYRIEA